MDITAVITKELNLQRWQAEAVIGLIDEGNTIPFIARYRKEAHGAMNDEQLRDFEVRLKYLRGLEERKASVIASIEEQGKLTEELRAKIDAAMTQTEVEDLYRPYKQKRRTRAMIAREKGLEPLAEYILSQNAKQPVEEKALEFVSEEKEVPDVRTAIQMAEDIIAERLSDDAACREWIRKRTLTDGLIVTEKKEAPKKTAKEEAPQNKKLSARSDIYENYYGYSEKPASIPGHRILAINRGENEKFLTVKIQAPGEEIEEYLARQCMLVKEEPKKEEKKQRADGSVNSFKDLSLLMSKPAKENDARKNLVRVKENPVTAPYIREAASDAYRRLIAPSIETEIRNMLTEKAEDGAMKVFKSNLSQLLMQPPIEGKTVLGWDPAFRTGCKLAVVDATGKVLTTTVIYPTEPQKKVAESKQVLQKLCKTYGVNVISVGNGTASRESEQVIADFLRESKLPVSYVIVNEAGASVYSASKLATEEFPNFDVGQRSAASIARRLQDPLAELVKIDPKSIGVGQYQHDMNQTKLGETLTAVVEDCVNSVGVDVNTASAALLGYVSGISKTVAKNIVDYREQNGSFRSRREFLKVPKLGPKAYEQCAGFLRIRDAKEALDMTGVHPESYEAAKKLLTALGVTENDLRAGATDALAGLAKMKGKDAEKKLEKLCEETGLGIYTLQDVIKELEKPGRDPREEIPGPVLRQDVLDLKDLEPGMVLSGTVRNIVDFGAFVDIGVHQDGLVHLSQMADRFVKHPLDVVKVGDVVRVKVLGVDPKKNRISLTMKGVAQN